MIILSPYSKRLRHGGKNPKNFPHWAQVVSGLREAKDVKIIQLAADNKEPRIEGVDDIKVGLSLKSITDYVMRCKTWASVDNFFPHLCSHINRPGTVVFGPSDPDIYGYPDNCNILRDRGFLIPFQFATWEEINYDESRFVKPEEVVEAILSFLPGV